MSSSSRRGGGKGRKRPQKAGNEDVADLEARCVAEAPAPGSSDGSKVAFAELALSKLTVVGLREGNFTKMTRIQQIALPHALAGRDIMGAAKTGSGKTLAFLVPVLERLYRQNWSSADGLGAVVMSPTRELALQIFEVLRVVGREHESLSVGLVTGGKRLDDEVERIVGMNILVCTPGRLLQHLEQTPGFHCDDVSILVLDEADRMLDMGFEREMNSIMEYMPPKEHGRQTLLFDATQPKSVKVLAPQPVPPRVPRRPRARQVRDPGEADPELHGVPVAGQAGRPLRLHEVAPEEKDHRVPLQLQAGG